ncbi:MAG TPA: hypothetical protein VJU59_38890, partial [Paraburkholderia sp.]|uniref:hypothetical protein n=1 Tax=Paraburkholderia sp. TaxID=1926495 RepID=UPI002B479609
MAFARAEVFDAFEEARVVARAPNWPQSFDAPSRKAYRKIKLNGVPYRTLRLEHVPILDREESISGLPSTLTVIYATPEVEMKQQVRRAGFYIAVASLVFLGITVLLALWGI